MTTISCDGCGEEITKARYTLRIATVFQTGDNEHDRLNRYFDLCRECHSSFDKNTLAFMEHRRQQIAKEPVDF